MRSLINKEIDAREIIVRCLLKSYLNNKKTAPEFKSVEPKPNENDVSMLRLNYCDEVFCIHYGLNLTDSSSNFVGLLYITPQIVESVNHWARCKVSTSDDNSESNGTNSNFVYSPLDSNRNPISTDIDLYTEPNDGSVPMHTDLKYNRIRSKGGVDEALNTKIRLYSRELCKRIKFSFYDHESGVLQETCNADIFDKYNSTPVLSIIIPYSKAGKYIKDCAQSVLSQCVGKPVEVIFINDGSENDFNVLKSVLNLYPLIATNYGHKNNKGLAESRNRGLEVARGEYVWFVDADDQIEDGAIDLILKQIHKKKFELYLFKIRDIEENGANRISTRKYYKGEIPLECEGVDIILRHYSYSPIQMYIINRNFLITNNLYFVEKVPHDLEIMPRLLLRAKYVQVVPEFIYRYYYHPKSNYKSDYSIKRTESILDIYNDYDKLLENLKDIKQRQAIYYTQFSLIKHIFNDPNKKQFFEIYYKCHIKERMDSFRTVLKFNFRTVRTISDVIKFISWYIDPRLYKFLEFRVGKLKRLHYM